MGEVKPVEEVVLFCGLLYSSGIQCAQVKRELAEQFGPVLAETEPIDFTFTEYYNAEMGVPIKRFFMAFNELIPPDRLPMIKDITNGLERAHAENGNRTVNIDPGYSTLSKVVLATTKDYAHRLYLGSSMYGEVTLSWQQNRYVDLPWTYPDYRTAYAKDFFTEVRKWYKEQKIENRK